MKRRNIDSAKLRRTLKKNRMSEGFCSSSLIYLKILFVWAFVMMADFLLDFRFEYFWPSWLLLRSIYDSFRYQGVAFSVFFVCVTVTSDMICFIFIPVQWLFFLAGTCVWVQYVWHADRGVCLPTVTLWLLFIYVEASVRLKELKTLPFTLDLCRPFAAHCIGYPVVTLGFGVKTYVSYRLRWRKQKEVAKENEIYSQLLREALPVEQNRVTDGTVEFDQQKYLSNLSSEDVISNGSARCQVSSSSSYVNNNGHNSTALIPSSQSYSSSQTSFNSSMNGNLVSTPNNNSGNLAPAPNNRLTTKNFHNNNSTSTNFNSNSAFIGGDSSSTAIVAQQSTASTGTSSSSWSSTLFNMIPKNNFTTNFTSGGGTSNQQSTGGNYTQRKYIHSSSDSAAVVPHQGTSASSQLSQASSSSTMMMLSTSSSATTLANNVVALLTTMTTTATTATVYTSSTSSNNNNTVGPLNGGGGVIGSSTTMMNHHPASSTSTPNAKDYNSTVQQQHQQHKDKVQDKDLYFHLESDIEKLKNELRSSKNREQELRRQLSEATNSEKVAKSDLQQLKQQQEQLQTKFQNLMKARQQDKENVSTLEKRICEEQKLKNQLEQLLKQEKKHQKKLEQDASQAQAQAAAATNKAAASANVTSATTKTDCTETCKQRRRDLENQLKQLRRECQQKDEQFGQLDGELRALRQYKEANNVEVMMSALSVMQEKNQHLEISLSAETRIKLDLFSALGDAKRQLEITSSQLAKREQELDEHRRRFSHVTSNGMLYNGAGGGQSPLTPPPSIIAPAVTSGTGIGSAAAAAILEPSSYDVITPQLFSTPSYVNSMNRIFDDYGSMSFVPIQNNTIGGAPGVNVNVSTIGGIGVGGCPTSSSVIGGDQQGTPLRYTPPRSCTSSR